MSEGKRYCMCQRIYTCADEVPLIKGLKKAADVRADGDELEIRACRQSTRCQADIHVTKLGPPVFGQMCQLLGGRATDPEDLQLKKKSFHLSDIVDPPKGLSSRDTFLKKIRVKDHVINSSR